MANNNPDESNPLLPSTNNNNNNQNHVTRSNPKQAAAAAAPAPAELSSSSSPPLPPLKEHPVPPMAEPHVGETHGWAADGVPMSVVGRPMAGPARAPWSSGLCHCFGNHDDFCGTDLEVYWEQLFEVSEEESDDDESDVEDSGDDDYIPEGETLNGVNNEEAFVSKKCGGDSIVKDFADFLAAEDIDEDDLRSLDGSDSDGCGTAVFNPRRLYGQRIATKTGLLGSIAPCVLSASNAERIGSSSASFTNHCMTYTALYLIGNSFFGWNCLAPWLSYTTRTAVRQGFNLEGNCEALTRNCGCCGSLMDDELQREQIETACDIATHLFCHPCSLCQEGREIRRRLPHPSFNAQQIVVMVPPGAQTMGWQ